MNFSQSSCVKTPDGFLAFEETCIDLNIVYFISGWYRYSLIGIIAFDIALIPFATICNILTVAAVMKNRSLQSVSNILLSSLAVSDALTGMITQTVLVPSLTLVLECKSMCWLFLLSFEVGYYLAIVSFLTVTVVTLDRYVAIIHPYRYQQYTATRTNIHRIIATTWLAPLIIVAISFATSRMWLQQVFLAILAPLTLGVSIFAQVRTVKTVKQIQKRENSLSLNRALHSPSKEPRRQTVNRKATKVATIILVTMIVCYLPQSVLTSIRMLNKSNRFGFQGLYDWTKMLVLVTSSLNPIIYCLLLKSIRQQVIKLAFPCRYRRQNSVRSVSLEPKYKPSTVRSASTEETAL